MAKPFSCTSDSWGVTGKGSGKGFSWTWWRSQTKIDENAKSQNWSWAKCPRMQGMRIQSHSCSRWWAKWWQQKWPAATPAYTVSPSEDAISIAAAVEKAYKRHIKTLRLPLSTPLSISQKLIRSFLLYSAVQNEICVPFSCPATRAIAFGMGEGHIAPESCSCSDTSPHSPLAEYKCTITLQGQDEVLQGLACLQWKEPRENTYLYLAPSSWSICVCTWANQEKNYKRFYSVKNTDITCNQ